MADCYPKETRSKVMSNIRSKNTKPEMLLRKALWKEGCRYKLHYKLIGKPDIVFVSKKVAVFIDGCFWHKCSSCYKEPKSNREYWLPKLERNVKRAKEVSHQLKKVGWNVIRIWEHDVKKDLKKIIKKN